MAAESRAGEKWLEAKWLRPSCLDHFPNVDSHRVENDFQFIDQRDVDGAIRVFQDLARLGDAGIADGHHFFDDSGVEIHGQIATGFVNAADDFWYCPRRVSWIARILT